MHWIFHCLNSHDDAQKAAGIKSALIELSEGTQWEPVSRAWVNQFSTLNEIASASVRLAISLAKRRFPDKTEAFQENDLHIHVPDGATPKDGPSAGITLITAIASLITDKAIDPYIAMTGEISLRGEVTAIGGLPEKLMAAQRAGVRQVLIPAENVEDLEDVPQETRNSLQIIPVENMDDVLSLCGLTNGKGGNHP